MSQQSAIVQTTNAASDVTPVLGTLQSVGPNNQTSPGLPNMQSSGTTTTSMQSQTQSQQTQYISQPSKQVQQSSTPSSFSDFPQVRYPYKYRRIFRIIFLIFIREVQKIYKCKIHRREEIVERMMKQ